MNLRKLVWGALVPTLSLTALGCGYSEEEWQAQLDKYNRLVAQNQSTEQKLAETEKLLEAERARVAALSKDLESMGVDMSKLNDSLASRNTELSKLSATLEEREKALAEYKARAAQLERIKQRFELLRAKLTELTNLGLEVKIRNNRMIISLPGDVLFPSGRDKLRTEGEEVLEKVAKIIYADPSLRNRFYQVAGHTDSQALRGGPFYDNWGLSLMRARSVLVYLIDPEKGKLPNNKWSAAGFSDTDPVAGNDTDEGRQKNRRCELVVVPSAEEVLDLKAIAN
ncbi:MAG: OmpA family protein [Polyangiaceae bacterium]